MAKKRFTDIEIWDKEWFMDLEPKYKCLIRYLFDKCDAVGMWKPNWKLASMQIGEPVSISDLKNLPKDQFEIIDGKIFLPDFIKFQYGTLSEASPAHKPVFSLIEKYNLSDRVFNRVSDTLQEKDKDKEEEKGKEKDKGGAGGNDAKLIIPLMLTEFKKHHPEYFESQAEDFAALGAIAQFICKKSKVSYQPMDGPTKDIILQAWGQIAAFVQDDGFYKSFSLKSIQNNIQTISQKVKDGKQATKGKSANSHISGERINTAFTQFYQGGQQAGSGAKPPKVPT